MTVGCINGHLKLNLTTKHQSFQLDSGSFCWDLSGVTVVFGRSGSGKSTLLRAIAGLELQTQGHLEVNGETWLDDNNQRPPQERHTGFVFQDAALFPHLSVQQNIAYGLKRLPKVERPSGQEWNETLQQLAIDHLQSRSVQTLSGGETQRVAIARALLMKPKLLCMDEPLSALDWPTKRQILPLIETVVKAHKVPMLYITHSAQEVEHLADRVVFMADGHIQCIQTLDEAMSQPDSPLFAEQGVVSLLQGKYARTSDTGSALTEVQIGQHRLWLAQAVSKNAVVKLRIASKDVSLALSDPKDLSITNHLPATIQGFYPQDEYHVMVQLVLMDGQRLFAEITRASQQRLQLKPGQKVTALIKSVAINPPSINPP